MLCSIERQYGGARVGRAAENWDIPDRSDGRNRITPWCSQTSPGRLCTSRFSSKPFYIPYQTQGKDSMIMRNYLKVLASVITVAVCGAAALASATAASAVSVTQVGRSSTIAVEGPDNSLYFYWQTVGEVPWHPE